MTRKLPEHIAALKADSTPLGGGRYRMTLRAQGRVIPPAPVPAPDAAALAEGDDAPPMADPNLLVQRFRFLSADTDLTGHFMRSPPPAELKAKVDLFSDRLVKADHVRSVQAVIGRTLKAEFAAANGKDPGGAEGEIEFDRRLNPTVVHALDRGLLDAVSVDIQFTARPSHPDLDEMQFWLMLGETVDGRLVTMLMEEIEGIRSVDVVDAGADPMARRLAASTNTPDPEPNPVANAGASPASSTPHRRKIMKERMCAKLGLDSTASDERVLEAFSASQAQAATDAAALANIYTASKCKDADGVCAKFIEFGVDYVPRSELATLQAELAKRDLDAICAAALADGRATPAELNPEIEGNLLTLAAGNAAALAAYLATRAPSSAVPVAPASASAPVTPGEVAPVSAALSDIETKIAAGLGLTAEQYRAHSDNLNARI